MAVFDMRLQTLQDEITQFCCQDAVPVGQLYFPSWERYEQMFSGIFEREYYNNNGPLLTEFESRIQSFLGVKHAICTSSCTMGLMIAAQALGLKKRVIVPAHTFIATALSLQWAGVEPVFCDVDIKTHHVDLDKLESLIDDSVEAILAVNLWGGAAEVEKLEAIADKYGLTLYFDSAQAFGCKVGDKAIGNFGHLEVFSFHATKVLSSAEGGCICTNDDALAAKIRAIRPSYGETNPPNIVKVANSRMSEAQAAIGLMSLDDFDENRANNKKLYHHYKNRLDRIPGITLLKPQNVSYSNYQSVVCEIEEDTYGCSRAVLIDVLKKNNILARRYFYPGVHKSKGFINESLQLNNTDCLSNISLQLPIGAKVDFSIVEYICNIIEFTHLEHAKA